MHRAAPGVSTGCVTASHTDHRCNARRHSGTRLTRRHTRATTALVSIAVPVLTQPARSALRLPPVPHAAQRARAAAVAKPPNAREPPPSKLCSPRRSRALLSAHRALLARERSRSWRSIDKRKMRRSGTSSSARARAESPRLPPPPPPPTLPLAPRRGGICVKLPLSSPPATRGAPPRRIQPRPLLSPPPPRARVRTGVARTS